LILIKKVRRWNQQKGARRPLPLGDGPCHNRTKAKDKSDHSDWRCKQASTEVWGIDAGPSL